MIMNVCACQGSVCEGWGYISIIVIFSFLYNVTKFLEFQTKTKYREDGWVNFML